MIHSKLKKPTFKNDTLKTVDGDDYTNSIPYNI